MSKQPKKTSINALLKGVSFINSPPAGVTIPSPPEGFVKPNSGDGRGLRPKRAEINVAPSCVEELARFEEYAKVFGAGAPPMAKVAQTLQEAAQWSGLRVSSETWNDYLIAQETAAWKTTRAQLAPLRAAFLFAAAADPSLKTKYPKLTELFTLGSEISKRGATKRSKTAQKTRDDLKRLRALEASLKQEAPKSP